MKRSILFVLGFAVTIAGMTLVLRDWPSVVIVFKGVSGAALAVAGLVMLFAVGLKK